MLKMQQNYELNPKITSKKLFTLFNMLLLNWYYVFLQL